jgi:hypothetical protein
MDNTGEITGRGKTPADLRRMAQIEAVQTMFTEEFPEEAEYPLQKKMATKWLGLCDDSACMVRDHVRELKRYKTNQGETLNSPKTYIERTLERKAAKNGPAPVQPAGDLSNQFAGKPHPSEMKEPTPEYLEKLAALRGR